MILLNKMKKNKEQNGYTLIETMIAISLFIVIVTLGMSALLNANALHLKSQGMRSIMDNLSFIMEDMSTSLRTGHSYDCITSGGLPSVVVATSGQTCGGIAFFTDTGNEWVYYIGHNINNTKIYSIFKMIYTSTGSNNVQLTPDEVSINPVSGFSVLGAESPADGDTQQPFVTIKLVGDVISQNVDTPFSLQTSVSQRGLDR